jgi:hypothetical protein
MRIRIDSRHEASARRLRDLYVEDAVVRAIVGLDRAIRRAAACMAALVTGRDVESRARRSSCRS